MANRYAIVSGNWSDTATWDGGTLPQAGDVVRPNGFTVTIDQNITVTELTNNASAPAIAGGQFTFGAGLTINANITCRVNIGNNGTFITATYGGGTSTINGDIIHLESGVSSRVLLVNGSAGGQLVVNGDIYKSGNLGNQFLRIILLNGNGNGFKLICNGFVSGMIGPESGTQSNMDGIVVDTNYIIDLNGVTQGKVNANASAGYGVNVTGNGNVINNYGLLLGGFSSIALNSPAVFAPNNLLNTLNHYGTASASVLHPTVIGGVIILQNGSSWNDNVNCASLRPLAQMIAIGAQVSYTIPIDVNTSTTLQTAGLLTGYPPEAKVEDGTVYGPSSEFEGTLLPVNIDTAQLAEDLLSEISTSSNALAERLRNVSTVQTTGTQISALTLS